MRKLIEGSMAVAEAIKRSRPHVVSAYPITPQTHIVEDLAQMVADGELEAQFINVESEHSAASLVLGAAATGARAFTATSSQGLLLMVEVLYNIAGLRLPVVLTCANRAVSSPLSIWNDHQDSMAARDTGWIQLYAEDNQEVADLHFQAYKIGEDRRVLLPVMVCMDGFVLTHAFEPVDLPEQEEMDAWLPPYDPPFKLDVDDPITLGAFCEPSRYMETRYHLAHAMEQAKPVIEEVAQSFGETFGRYAGGLIEAYRMEDATDVFVGMGSMMSNVKDAVDELRDEGHAVGALRVRCFRPFPAEALCEALRGAERVAVLEKAVSLGVGGALSHELRSTLAINGGQQQVFGFVVGLGGRDITAPWMRRIHERMRGPIVDGLFADLYPDLLSDELVEAWQAGWGVTALTGTKE
jgi:pyruvate ferredoxin oxidoreductase alpha subunit